MSECEHTMKPGEWRTSVLQPRKFYGCEFCRVAALERVAEAARAYRDDRDDDRATTFDALDSALLALDATGAER